LMAGWYSSLNILRTFTHEVHNALKLSLKNEALKETWIRRYSHILFSCLCAAYGSNSLCAVVSSNPLLHRPIRFGRRFIEAMNRLSERAVAISGASILYAIEKAGGLLKARGKKPFIILCDCLSLPEYVYLYDRFTDRVQPGALLYAINPGGKTKTFEHLAKAYLNIASEEVTMKDIAKGLQGRMEAAGWLLYRDLDDLVHRHGKEGFTSLLDLAVSLFRVVEELALKIDRLSEQYCLLVMSDHGYDVATRDGQWCLAHRFKYGELNLSLFSTTILIG